MAQDLGLWCLQLLVSADQTTRVACDDARSDLDQTRMRLQKFLTETTGAIAIQLKVVLDAGVPSRFQVLTVTATSTAPVGKKD